MQEDLSGHVEDSARKSRNPLNGFNWSYNQLQCGRWRKHGHRREQLERYSYWLKEEMMIVELLAVGRRETAEFGGFDGISQKNWEELGVFGAPAPWNCSAITGRRKAGEPGLGGRPRVQGRACEASQHRC